MTVSLASTLSRRWVIHGNTRERRQRFGLAATHQKRPFFCGSNDFKSCGRITMPSGMCSRPSVCAIFYVIDHAYGRQIRSCDAGRGDVDDLLNSGDRNWRSRKPAPCAALRGTVPRCGPTPAVRRRIARPLDIGAIAEECQHAFLPVARQGMQAKWQAINGRWIHLEVARMDDHAHRRCELPERRNRLVLCVT